MGLDKSKPLPRRPRLKEFDYRGYYIYSITILTDERKRIFTDQEISHLILGILKETAREKGFELLTYCLMPDHLHLLVAGKRENSNLKQFISLFKQKSGFEFKRRYHKKLWHLSYYDHILRKSEDIETVSRYILNNPVRKGLVESFAEYPYGGAIWL